MRNETLIFLFLSKTYVVGTQKNRLNETAAFAKLCGALLDF